jgi:Na+-translocating ferredoxin:NAD+ oxidoreductase RnfD subunit
VLTTYRRYPARNDVLLAAAAVPLYITAAGMYGLRVFLLLAVSLVIGWSVEVLTAKAKGGKREHLGYPAWILLPLVFPPVFPVWMVCVAVFFGTVIGIVFFGGHGRQLVSPVALGWTFASLSFPTAFGFGWSYPFEEFGLGFSRYAASLPTIDHPAALFAARLPVGVDTVISGSFPQPLGSAVPLAVIAAGIILLVLRAVDFRSSLSFLVTLFVLQSVLHVAFPADIGPVHGLLVGNTLIAGFFVLPDLRTAPRTAQGRWITGVVAGCVGFLVRNFSSFPDGVFYAVLFGNTFSAIIDEWVLDYRYRRSTA